MPAEESDPYEAMLRRRAEALARPAVRPDAEQVAALLVFVVGSTRAGVAAERVREVLGPGPLLRLPVEPGGLAGLRAARRALVAVADLSVALGTASTVPRDQRHVVVLDGPTPLGILVDALVGLAPLPSGLARGAGTFTAGITPDHVVVLDPDRLLADDRFTVRPGPAAIPT